VFAADGRAARRLGVQRLLVRPLGAHPFVYRGAVGPLALPAARLAAVDGALQALVREFGLRGLCSLDFVDDGEQAWLLEVNPRPSASLALYGPSWMRAHVEAALHGRLPAVDRAKAETAPGDAGPAGATSADAGRADRATAVTPAPSAGTAGSSETGPHAPVRAGAGRPTVRGTEIVFARTSLAFDAARAQSLAARADCHDLPAAGTRFAPGDPVCSVDAEGPDVDTVIGALAAKRRSLRDAWATENPRA
jgi:predicted ATP-grasp superfamily ATP-dependent carboligase